MNMKSKAGFTLVELIVVIAILAILAGVAIPAYTGYIAKAEEANDLQLLSALSTSFGSACLENDIYDMDSMVGTQFVLKNGLITGLKLPGGASATANATLAAAFTADQAQALMNSFALYYGENMKTPFKVYVLIAYTEDGFKGYDEEEAEGIVIEAVKQAIANSNYYGNLQALTADVGSLVTGLKGYLDSPAGADLSGSGFADYLENVLGKDAESLSAQEKANAAVLYLGHTASNMTNDTITDAKKNVYDLLFGMAESLEDKDEYNDTLDFGGCSTVVEGSQLASYAALYATAEAIALSENAKGNTAAMDALKNVNPSNPQDVVSAVTDVFKAAGADALYEYITPTDSNDPSSMDLWSDMDAYFETMKAVNGKEDTLKNDLSSDKMFSEENATIKDILGQLQG